MDLFSCFVVMGHLYLGEKSESDQSLSIMVIKSKFLKVFLYTFFRLTHIFLKIIYWPSLLKLKFIMFIYYIYV